MKKRYDWDEVQKFYDEGNSKRETSKHFGMSYPSLLKAQKRGDLKTRNISEAMVLVRRKYPEKFKHSDETKEKMSKFRIQYYKDHPEEHPNRKLSNNRNNWTYPERLAAEWFELNGIEFLYNKKVLDYYPDFLIGDIIVEIDGERWHSSEESILNDTKRDDILKNNGYVVYRIKAKNVLNNLEQILNKLKLV